MNWFRRFMLGRYGTDQLSIAMLILFLIFALCNIIHRSVVFSVIELLLVLIMYLRMFSKDITRRSQENEKFMKLWRPVTRWFTTRKNRFRSRKEYRYFKCPGCKRTLRVPRGKGELTITCPICKTKLTKRT